MQQIVAAIEGGAIANTLSTPLSGQKIDAPAEDWPDLDRNGNIKATLRNAKLAMRRLDLQFSFDEFRQRKYVQGYALQENQGELTNDRCAALRNLVLERFGFDPGSEHTRDALNMLCLQHRHHPICDYLDRIEWDRTQRLSELLPRYFDAANTPFNIAIGRAMLIAAVRRVRDPGGKFDTIGVLEGPQGTGKSTALLILEGAKNFSDNDILALDSKAQWKQWRESGFTKFVNLKDCLGRTLAAEKPLRHDKLIGRSLLMGASVKIDRGNAFSSARRMTINICVTLQAIAAGGP